MALDEAGNIPIHNLSEQLGVGRGRRSAMVLGYQNVGQVYKQHGRDGAQAILGSVGTMVFLPGLDSETAQYAVKRIGRTTVLQHTSVDAPGSQYDNERDSETGRDLLDAAELRQMVEHSQAVAITGSAPPIIFGFPPYRKGGRVAQPLPRDVARPVSLRDAEMALARQRSEEFLHADDQDLLSPTDGTIDDSRLGGSSASPVEPHRSEGERADALAVYGEHTAGLAAALTTELSLDRMARSDLSALADETG
jgi:type IV secretory pathway TraG/TraD family ATPase VirD4